MDKRSLSERDICTKFITPALRKAGWDEMRKILERQAQLKARHTSIRHANDALIPATLERMFSASI